MMLVNFITFQRDFQFEEKIITFTNPCYPPSIVNAHRRFHLIDEQVELVQYFDLPANKFPITARHLPLGVIPNWVVVRPDSSKIDSSPQGLLALREIWVRFRKALERMVRLG